MVAGAVAMVATGVGAIGGAAFAATALGSTVATIATYASVAAVAATIGAQLTMKKPGARGAETQVRVETDPAQPYAMGRVYFGGIMRHDVAYGGKVDKVHNPYRWTPVVYSGCGPVQSISPRIDYLAPSTWYSGFLSTDTQLGETPESNALAPFWAGAPNWSAAAKLSGQAAIGWSFKFDKKGVRFASGIPPFGALMEGVKVYDPRLDSTYPGGSGAHRITNEATWTYSANPALHALTYAYGRHQNGKKVFGIGLPASGIDTARYVAWANVCDSNGWEVSGIIYEPSDRWVNLKDIMVAGRGEPAFANGVLSVRYSAPMVALDTVTEDDLADDDVMVTAMQSYRNRINGIVPKYRSEAHNWEYVTSELVTVPSYVSEDGEDKNREQQYNFVAEKDQAAQLAAYDIVDAREFAPIEVTLKPQWRGYRPGECLHLDLPSLGVQHDAIILSRNLDPATMKVKLTLISETPEKHDYALGRTGTAPPTPTLANSEDRDETASDPFVNSLPDLIDEAGVLLNGVVTTGSIAAGSVTVPDTTAVADVFVAAGATVTVATTDWIAVGDSTDGGALVMAFGEVDSGLEVDVGARLNLYIDSGSGFVLSATAGCGIGTNNGDTRMRATVLASETIVGVSEVRIRMDILSVPMPSTSTRSFTLRSPQIVIMGGKR